MNLPNEAGGVIPGLFHPVDRLELYVRRWFERRDLIQENRQLHAHMLEDYKRALDLIKEGDVAPS